MERDIRKIDLQRARRYGIKEEGHPGTGRLKYTFAGITFIYDPKTKTEVTSYACRDFASDVSGTKVTDPVVLERYEWPNTEAKTRDESNRDEFRSLREEDMSKVTPFCSCRGHERVDEKR